MLRGINRQDIFEEPEDYWTFIKILSHETRTRSLFHKDGKITNTATYTANPQNPNGFQEIKRVDRVGASHNGIPTPHVHENGKVRPAKDGDL